MQIQLPTHLAILSPPALNDTWVVHVEQISPILVEKQDRIKLICWRDGPALYASSNETTRKENALSELVEVAFTDREFSWQRLKGVRVTLPSASISSAGLPLSS